MTNFEKKEWRKDAEQIFKVLDGFDHLTAQNNSPAVKISFSELYAYATNAAHVPSEALQNALSSDLTTRRDLNKLIKKQSIVHMARAAAASSGDIEQREADGFSLTLKPSKANSDQVYLIIESMDRDESPSLLFIEQEAGPTLRLPIDDFREGEAQILLSSQDDIVKALRKPSCEVILS